MRPQEGFRQSKCYLSLSAGPANPVSRAMAADPEIGQRHRYSAPSSRGMSRASSSGNGGTSNPTRVAERHVAEPIWFVDHRIFHPKRSRIRDHSHECGGSGRLRACQTNFIFTGSRAPREIARYSPQAQFVCRGSLTHSNAAIATCLVDPCTGLKE